MKCKNCKKEDKQIKAGKTRAGSQIYKCKHCGKTYTPNPKERKYSEEIKRQAIKLYMEGNSGRAVGRILNEQAIYWTDVRHVSIKKEEKWFKVDYFQDGKSSRNKQNEKESNIEEEIELIKNEYYQDFADDD